MLDVIYRIAEIVQVSVDHFLLEQGFWPTQNVEKILIA